MSKYDYECGRCFQQASGYTQLELQKQGWCWHPIPGIGSREFIVCDECEALAKRRRAPAFIPAPREYCSECGTKHTIINAEHAVVGTPFNKAIPTVLCRNCDRFPELHRRRTEYEPDLLYPPTEGAS